MDAFFAAVEVKEDPALSGKPVVVGGTGPRGVVASASYEARGFGVRSAMPGREARRLCPHLVFLPARFELYHHYSELLHGVLQSFTPLVEGIGLDEAFLDVTGAASLFGTPAEMATEVRKRVSAELGLKCSVGAGPNKLVAKLASKAAKPRASQRGPSPGPGAVVVSEDEVLNFIWPMPVEALWGVGPASRERLHKVGVTTVGQLAALPEAAVVGALGKSAGEMVHSLSWGRDARAVVADRELKSIGHEETYPTDVVDRDELERRLVLLADSVAARIRRHGVVARTLTLKFRYGDFTTLTRSHTFATPQMSGPGLWTAAKELLGSLELRNGVRLLGLSASGLVPVQSAPGEQLQLELSAAATGSQEDVAPLQSNAAAQEPSAVTASSAAGSDQAGSGAAPGWERASQAIDAVRARSAKAPLAQPPLLVKSAAPLASTIAARALAPLSRRAAPRPHFCNLWAQRAWRGQRLAIGSTCENWASEIRFRQFEPVDATPLGRRLERRGVGSGSHGRPEPSARAPSRLRHREPSQGRDALHHRHRHVLAEQLQPTGLGRRLHGYPGLALRTVVPLRPRARPVHPVVGYKWSLAGPDDVQAASPRERGLDGEPERSSNRSPERG